MFPLVRGEARPPAFGPLSKFGGGRIYIVLFGPEQIPLLLRETYHEPEQKNMVRLKQSNFDCVAYNCKLSKNLILLKIFSKH